MDCTGVVEVAALGRPFSLGMLYDCRNDSLIPGMTLWDCEDLKKNVQEIPQTNIEFETVASESIADKTSALNVEASLKGSFLSGLINVEGSGKYLNDQKTSNKQARVTLRHKVTTMFQQLSMNHLGRDNVKHPNVFQQGIATHVVTGILYGAQAFLVFDREVSKNENCQDIQGKLKAMIEKISLLSGKVDSSPKMEENVKKEENVKRNQQPPGVSLEIKKTEKENVENLSWKFHGEFCLPNAPTSFQDAIEVCQSLPGLLEANREKAVPVKVWLMPLTCLDSSAAKLVRQISPRLVQEIDRAFEDLSEMDMRCNDAMKTTTAQQFQQIRKDLKSFKDMCSEFKIKLQQSLAEKLPLIRGGEEEETKLAEILSERHLSPFNTNNMSKWLDCKEKEIGIIKSVTSKMRNTKVVSSQSDFQEELITENPVLCFVFTSLGDSDPYLRALSNYLAGTTKSEAEDPHIHDEEREQWFPSRNVHEEMRMKAKLFRDFEEANKEDENIKFLAVGLMNDEQKGLSVNYYKDSELVKENFQPPSKPETVTVLDFNHNSVTLNISPPRFGVENVSSYSVEFRVSGEEDWHLKTESTAEDVPVSNLRPNTKYDLRCRAVTAVGVGPACIVSDAIKTLPCSPPGNPQVESNSCEITVKWEKPVELRQDVVSYIVEYANTTISGNVQDLQWKEMKATAEYAIIRQLQSETKYAIRVRCDCGSHGRSKESVTVDVCTKKRRVGRLAENLKRESEGVGSNLPPIYKLPLVEEDLDIDGCRSFTFGRKTLRQNRTIILLGGTGSGKSTLVNGMINYLVGVERKDNFRFQLVNDQAHSQTSEVNVYRINHQKGFKVPFSLTIVDTPGFGDSRGEAGNKEITEQIRRLFTSVNGISEIDAVCIVTEATVTQLTATQKYVFDSVKHIFGKNVAKKIQNLVTFAEDKQPSVLQAINKSGVACPKNECKLPVHFKFNNSALFANNNRDVTDEGPDEDDEKFDKNWKMGAKSMHKFFDALGKMNTSDDKPPYYKQLGAWVCGATKSLAATLWNRAKQLYGFVSEKVRALSSSKIR